MYRKCRAVTRLRVGNRWLGKAATDTVFAVSGRCFSSGVSRSNIEKLLPPTDQFPARHIGINPETEQQMTNFLGLEVDDLFFLYP